MKSNIVCTTSDEASVMQKYGKLSPTDQQLYHNHVVHLAVLSGIYEKCEVEGPDISSDDDEFDVVNSL